MQGTILEHDKMYFVHLSSFFCSYSNIFQWSLFKDYFGTLEIPY